MSSDNATKLFWLAYCKIIQNEIGQLGDSNAIFFSTKSQRGPPVEPYNAVYTDYGIYNFGNQLLNSDNLFYTPAATNTYTSALIAYLSWVDVGGDASDAQKLNVMQAKKTFDAYQSVLLQELKKASADYNEMASLGIIPSGQKFGDWIVNNAPGYQNANNALQSAAAQYKSAVLSLNGPLSAQWNQQLDRLNIAQNSYDRDPIPGLTMKVTAAAPPTISEAYDKSITGGELPAPTDTYSVALFGCPAYRGIVKGWQGNATKPPAPTPNNTHTLDLSQAKSIKETDFGHTKIGGDVGFNYGSILSFGVDASSDNTEESLTSHITETNVKITVYWDETAKASISPGVWNIANPRGTYPKLKSGAPQSAQILVRPAEVLLVSKLGYDVELSGDIKDEFDKKVKDVKSAGGYVRVFGIPISIGASGSSETQKTTHTGDWDSTKGKFSVKPSVDAGYATVLAVIGEKIQTF